MIREGERRRVESKRVLARVGVIEMCGMCRTAVFPKRVRTAIIETDRTAAIEKLLIRHLLVVIQRHGEPRLEQFQFDFQKRTWWIRLPSLRFQGWEKV